MTSLLTDEISRFIGVTSEAVTAGDTIEPSAVRRYAQAILTADPDYAPGEAHAHAHAPGAGAAPAAGEGPARHGGPVAPPLYPVFMVRRPYGSPDVLSERAEDPDFDGLVMAASDGLPELPLPGLALLNGGSEVELFRYARHGERVVQRSRYADITERQSRSGPMLLVITETEYRTTDGELLLRARKTIIRR